MSNCRILQAQLLSPFLHAPLGHATKHVSSEPADQRYVEDSGLANEVGLDEVSAQRPTALASCYPRMIANCSHLAEEAQHIDCGGHIGISPQWQGWKSINSDSSGAYSYAQREDDALTCSKMQMLSRQEAPSAPRDSHYCRPVGGLPEHVQ
jgi:hypothetical protein